MSADTVDDLEAAEDTAGAFAHHTATILEFRKEYPWTGLGDAPPHVQHALDALADLASGWATYCRPTCGWRDNDPHECDDDEDCCGCPCNHELED